jgi:hypothetical protein
MGGAEGQDGGRRQWHSQLDPLRFLFCPREGGFALYDKGQRKNPGGQVVSQLYSPRNVLEIPYTPGNPLPNIPSGCSGEAKKSAKCFSTTPKQRARSVPVGVLGWGGTSVTPEGT